MSYVIFGKQVQVMKNVLYLKKFLKRGFVDASL